MGSDYIELRLPFNEIDLNSAKAYQKISKETVNPSNLIHFLCIRLVSFLSVKRHNYHVCKRHNSMYLSS